MIKHADRIGNWSVNWFLWREENWRTQRKTLGAGTRTNNKINPHVTQGLGTGHSGGWRVLSPLHSPL